MRGKDIESGEAAANWVSEMKEDTQRWRDHSIYRIPRNMKRNRSNVYEPQTVSIGPYHHGEPHLKSMEEHKHRALLVFLDRSAKPLGCYVEALAPVVEDLRNAYQDLAPVWKHDTGAFLKLMILDGCFLMEIMPAIEDQTGYASEDPVFSKHAPYLKRDMLMLENQIPLQVLALLLETEDIYDGFTKQNLSKLNLKFFSQRHDDAEIEKYDNSLHILELYRRSILQLRLMDSIIHGGRDVKLLHSGGILRKALSSGKACSNKSVANLFNSLNRDIALHNKGSLSAEHKRMADYCETHRCTVYSNRMHDYVAYPFLLEFPFSLSPASKPSTLSSGYYHPK